MQHNDFDNDYEMTEEQYQDFNCYMLNTYDILITRRNHEMSSNVVVEI